MILNIIYSLDVNRLARDIKPIQERIDLDMHSTCCRLSGLIYRLMGRSSCTPATSYTANGGLSNGIATSVFDDGLQGFLAMSAISNIPGWTR